MYALVLFFLKRSIVRIKCCFLLGLFKNYHKIGARTHFKRKSKDKDKVLFGGFIRIPKFTQHIPSIEHIKGIQIDVMHGIYTLF